MFKSSCGYINITIAKSISDIVFQPSDWSIINIPVNDKDVKQLSDNLFNMPTSKHVCLVLNRNKKSDFIKGVKYTGEFGLMNKWKLIDSLSISYDKPASSSSSNLQTLSEVGLLLYKGDAPNLSATSWASGGLYSNATNEWILLPNEDEKKNVKKTYSKKFSWELALIMTSMCDNKEYGRFVYGIPISQITSKEAKSLAEFCRKYDMYCELVASSKDEALNFIELVDGE